jgi:hypothetical protein
VNPWRVLFDWAEGLSRRLGYRDGLVLNEPYPEALGIWPAVGLYLTFVWIENVFSGSYVPRNIALFALAYSLITLYGMAFFGKETWLRRGDTFSVFFGLLGRFAPTEVRVKNLDVCPGCDGCDDAGGGCVNCYECFARAAPEERELNLRLPAVGLGLPEKVIPGGAAFVIVVLAGVTFDGLLETPLWLEIVRLTPVTQTLGTILLPLLFFGIYLGFVELSRILGGGGGIGFRRFAAAYAFSLVPIAIAYQAAHYYTYLLIQGQMIVSLVSDPLGWGWNLFGTADFEPAPHARPDGPLHDDQPLDPGPTHSRVGAGFKPARFRNGRTVQNVRPSPVTCGTFQDRRMRRWSTRGEQTYTDPG